MQKSERSIQRIMIKCMQILNKSIINTGRSWKLLDRRNEKIWEKGSNSKQNDCSNAQNVECWNVSHNSDSDWRDAKENLKVSPNSETIKHYYYYCDSTLPLRGNCPYLEFFWSVFFRIRKLSRSFHSSEIFPVSWKLQLWQN